VAAYLVNSTLLLAVAFAFGVVLKLSDLLQEHGYRWFKGAALVTGFISAGLAVGMLALSHDELRLFWLAVLISWVLRGRIDGANHGVMAVAVLLTILIDGPALSLAPWAFGYFLAVLLPLGVIHDVLQYSSFRAPKPIEWFFEHQHLYWYLLAIGWCVLFQYDAPFVLCLYGFVKGYGLLYDETRREALRRFGIEHDPEPRG